MKHWWLGGCLIMVFGFWGETKAQQDDAAVLRQLFDSALLSGESYENLRYLCKEIGGRLSGSPEAAEAVAWTEATMRQMELDRVFRQEVMVPHWVRGAPSTAQIVGGKSLNVCALGGSVSAPPEGLTAQIVEVNGLHELADLGEARLKGRILFYNRPMNARLLNTFHAYGGCVDQRVHGASEAAKYGAVAVIVRSMNLRMDDYPHTGTISMPTPSHRSRRWPSAPTMPAT